MRILFWSNPRRLLIRYWKKTDQKGVKLFAFIRFLNWTFLSFYFCDSLYQFLFVLLLVKRVFMDVKSVGSK